MSLKLLEFCEVRKQPFRIGLMGHANTTRSFRALFKYFNGENIVRMVDSGVFTKEGNLTNGYERLYDLYQEMGTEYGIMIDIIKDKKKTIDSAKIAIKAYENYRPKFKLVGVAQGITIDDYLECYEKLKDAGFDYIAVGGLLKKIENTSRFTRVRDEDLLRNVTTAIREAYPKDWLFLLGCYHPSRQSFFKQKSIFGADYKGWILNYTNPGQEARNMDRELACIEKNLGVKDCWLTRRRNMRQEAMLDSATRTKLKEIDKMILASRIEIAKGIWSDEYTRVLKELADHLNKSEDELRRERFAQTKGYLDQKVFAHFRQK